MAGDVFCVRCGDPYRAHEPHGGPCRVDDEDGRCPCLGFWWVDPYGPPASYAPTSRSPVFRG